MTSEQYKLLVYKLKSIIDQIKAQDDTRSNLMEMADGLADDLGFTINWNKYSINEHKS